MSSTIEVKNVCVTKQADCVNNGSFYIKKHFDDVLVLFCSQNGTLGDPCFIGVLLYFLVSFPFVSLSFNSLLKESLLMSRLEKNFFVTHFYSIFILKLHTTSTTRTFTQPTTVTQQL